MKKCFYDLTRSDVLDYPIWRFTNRNPNDELEIESVDRRSFADLSGLIIAAKVEFADSSQQLALHQGVSLAGPTVNDHFLSLTFERDGVWFPLARYHDVAIENFGPNQLAEFVGKPVKDVFPIKYDLRAVQYSDPQKLTRVVRDVPISRLSKEQIISLSLLRG